MPQREPFDAAESEPGATGKHLFAIGNANYRDGWGELPHVKGDVAAIIDVFRHFGFKAAGRYQQGMIDPPTGAFIENGMLEWMEDEHREDDRLVIYAAGHGINDPVEKAHYLACADTSSSFARRTVGALRTSRLVELASVAGARRLLVILDTCYAGDAAAEALAVAAKNQLASAASTAQHRWTWKSLEILASARSREEANDGAFAAAFASVLREKVIDAPILAGNRPRYIQLSWVVGEINRAFHDAGLLQRADHAQLHGDGVGFLPNPHFVPGLPEELDLAEQRTLAGERRVHVIGGVEHFGPRARGVHSATQAGHYFTGRTAILTRLALWLLGRDERDVRVFQVTGSPGIGKSSVLGRMVALADPAMRAGIPDSTVVLSADIPVGTIDVAVHAARRTLSEILDVLAEALGVTGNDPGDIVKALKARNRPFTVVIDALDEAGSGGSARDCMELMAFLARAAAGAPQLRLLLGARRHVFTSNPIAVRTAKVDLDDQGWAEHGDIIAYATRLLASPHGPGSDTNIAQRLTARAAVDIADVAGRNYLIARLIARALADRDEEFWRTDPALWHQLLPPAASTHSSPAEAVGAAFRWALRTQSGPREAARVRALLSPLAYAKGAGMPLALVWPAAASAFAGGPVTERDLTRLLSADSAAPYVVEALDAHGRSVYRLYHQALADDLRQPPEAASRQASAAAALFERLYDAVPRASDGAADWQHADPYLLDYLPAHAADAHAVDDLLGDVGYLIHARPAALMPFLDQATAPGARLMAAIYRGCIGHLHAAEPDVRRWALASSAARYGMGQLVSRPRSAPHALDVWPRWSASSPQPALLNSFIGHTAFVRAVTCAELHGQPVAVTGSGDGTVRVWDLGSGRAVCPPLTGHDEVVCGLACAVIDGEPVVLSVGGDSTMRIWDPIRGEEVNQAPTANETCTWSVACIVVDGRPMAVTGGGTRGGCQLWDLSHSSLEGKPLEAGPAQVTSVACAMVGSRPTAIGADANYDAVWMWDLTSRELLGEPIRIPIGRARAVACAQVDGRPVAVVVGEDDHNSYICRFDLESRRQIGRPFRIEDEVDSITCAVIDGRPYAVVAGYLGGRIHVWDLSRRGRDGKPVRGPFDGVIGIGATAVDNRPVAVTGNHDHLVQVWDLTPRKRVGRPLAGHEGRRVNSITCTTVDGRPAAVSIGDDETLRTWDMADARQAGVLNTGHVRRHGLTCVTGPTGQPLAVTIGDAGIMAWDLAAQEQVGRAAGAGRTARHALTSTILRGRPVALIGGINQVEMLELPSMARVGTLAADGEEGIDHLKCMTMPSGQVIAVGYKRRYILAWDLSTGRRLSDPISYPADARYHFHSGQGLDCLVLNGTPVAVTLRSASADSSSIESRSELLAWDLRHGRQYGSALMFPGRDVRVLECALIDGIPVVFAGGEERRLRMWDLASHTLIGEWPMPGIVNSLSFSPAGFVAVAAGADVLILDATTQPRRPDLTR